MASRKSIMSRYFFIIICMGLIGAAIIVKAFIIMFAETEYWQAVADRFVKENVTVKPNRGNILSADGKLMASSLPEYRIYMDFLAGGEKKDTLLKNNLDEISKGLNKIFPDKSARYFKNHLEKGRKSKSRNYLIYPGRISYIQYKEAKKLPVFNLNKYSGGFHEQVYNQRKKPFGSLAERTLGDVYPDTTKGAKNGIELAFDTLLSGKNGVTRRQKVKNKYVNIVEKAPIDGYDIISTIDVDMQDICEKALQDKLKEINANEGVVVLMEVATGEVKAIVNMTKCSDGKYREIRNGAISNMLEPGSTFKTASIMVALEDGKISLNDGVDTGNGVKTMHKRTMRDHNWRSGGYHYLDLEGIMMKSSNIGVSVLIDKHYGDNPDKFVDGLYRMSLHQPLNLQIAGEGKPNIRRPKDGNWSKTALPWMSIGYETQIPPINTLTFYNAIANNGKMVKPKFVKAIAQNGEVVKTYPTEVINPSICSEKTIKEIQYLLEKVVSKGLGRPAGGSKRFPVAGKTGTAQISKGSSGYTSGTVDYLVSFCGYFPADTPKYSCIVAIQKSGGPASGGLMAGSVFGKIADRVYTKDIRTDINHATDSVGIHTPKVKMGDILQAKLVLDDLKIATESSFKTKGVKEIWGSPHQLTDKIVLAPQESPANTIPDVTGMGAKDAVYLLENKGLKVKINGVGKVHRQSIAQGTAIKKGQQISLQLN